MDTAIIVALVTAVGGTLAAAIAAYSSIKKAHRNEIAEIQADIGKIRQDVQKNDIRLDTLWSVYVEDAIRSAQKSGIAAARSAVKPTKDFDKAMPQDLQLTVHNETLSLAARKFSVYDITIELWQRHQRSLLKCAYTNDIPVQAAFGGLIVFVNNILMEHDYITEDDMPQAMVHKLC